MGGWVCWGGECLGCQYASDQILVIRRVTRPRMLTTIELRTREPRGVEIESFLQALRVSSDEFLGVSIYSHVQG